MPRPLGLEALTKKGRRFLLGPPLDGWIGVYPDGAGQDFAVALALRGGYRAS